MSKVIVSRGDGTNLRIRRTVCYIAGVLEILLACRFVLKLLGANPKSGFASVVYAVSRVFLAPFAGIFRAAVAQGVETKSILEPGTIIAMIVYALVAWGIVKLIRLCRTPRNTVVK